MRASCVNKKSMQALSDLAMMVEHIRSPGDSVYHGDGCLWCRMLQTRLTNSASSDAKKPYLHPGSSYLHSSGRSTESTRRWLVVDRFDDPAFIQSLRQYQGGYTCKYQVDTSIELSSLATQLTETTLDHAVRWFLRGKSKTLMLTLLQHTDIPIEIPNHNSVTTPLWVFLDHGREFRQRRVGLSYMYKYSDSGHSHLTVHRVTLPTQGTVLVWYLRKTSHVSHDSEYMVFQRVLYEILIARPGHASIEQILSIAHELLSPIGLCLILETNKVLNLSECFFGHEFVILREDPIPEPNLQPPLQTDKST